MTACDVVVLWLVGAELELAVAEVADGSREVSEVLAVAGVLGQKKLALDRNTYGPQAEMQGHEWLVPMPV